MTIRMSARVAGFAVLAAEVTAIASQADGMPARTAWTFLIALQFAAILWATRPQSASALRIAAPACLAAVTGAAVWAMFAITVPLAAGDASALAAVAATGLVVAVLSRADGRHGLRAAIDLLGLQLLNDLPGHLVGAAGVDGLRQPQRPPGLR
ncbi:hypothetical protein [Catellatospora sp. TT07R-123]|uniref:hypothetical protein n=1 Tax=Catellatospora sp. TT07R-123 TaxID=2733863 RepID=UPI001BB3B378|nr:hypothetical protein [Catellatospora sp. TT07R-123]